MRITDNSLDFLAWEAAGSPLLMQLYCYIACLSSGILETQDIEKDVNITADDFSFIMKKWGIQKLESCKPIWDKVTRFSDSTEGIPLTFIKRIMNKLKEADPRLVIDLNKLMFWPKYKKGILDLISKLNTDDDTADIFSLDEEKGSLGIGRPSFISYIRWIYGK
jgi:hypothetical protein